MFGRIIRALIYIGFLAMAFYLVVWFLAGIGLSFPPMVVHIFAMILVLIAILVGILAVADVKALAQAKLGDDVIISQIRNSHTVYHLSAADIIDLRNAGVSNRVIEFMIGTPSTAGGSVVTQSGTTYVTQAPPPVPVETMVVAPAPGYVWVGGEWIWNGRWVWSAGHWAYPPHLGAIWIGGSWGHSHHGWHHMTGGWR